jgi:hypothetical protein
MAMGSTGVTTLTPRTTVREREKKRTLRTTAPVTKTRRLVATRPAAAMKATTAEQRTEAASPV